MTLTLRSGVPCHYPCCPKEIVDMPNPGKIITIKNLSKLRVHGDSSFELRVNSFEVMEGEFIGLVGSSGSGKSTLLDILALVSSPSKVEYFKYCFNEGDKHHIDKSWKSNSVETLARIRGNYLGYILQSGGLLPFLSVEQNILLPFQIKGQVIDKSEVVILAKELDILDVFAKKPQYLSGGQRQRVSVLRALASNPKLVLADEPTAAVDSERAEIMVRRMKVIARKYHTTMIMVTHDLSLVNKYADRLYQLQISRDGENKIVSNCVQVGHKAINKDVYV